MTNQLPQIDKLQRTILRTTADYERVIARFRPADWWGPREFDQWSSDVEFGPRWSPTAWFLARTNIEIVAWGRALRRLAKRKLVEVHSLTRKDTHVKTTAAGRKALRAIKAEGNGAHG